MAIYVQITCMYIFYEVFLQFHIIKIQATRLI